MKLTDKNILVTGATSGIGKGIAIKCAEKGANLIITYAHKLTEIQDTQQTIKALGRKCEVVKLDLTQAEDIKKVINSIKKLGKIHVLVNNAGIIHREAFINIAINDYIRILDTNLKGPFFLTQIIANLMIEQQEGGSIINISSVSDDVISPNLSHYQIAKAGIAMLTKSAAYELAPYKIRVNTISPGLVKTEMNRDQWETKPEIWEQRIKNIPLGRTGTPQDIANAVIFLASDEAGWITGARLEVDGGSHLIL